MKNLIEPGKDWAIKLKTKRRQTKKPKSRQAIRKGFETSADMAILGTCLEKMWVITHETPLQAYGHFGAIAQRLEW